MARRVICHILPLVALCFAVAACAVKTHSGAGRVVPPSVVDAAEGALWREPTYLDLTYKYMQGATRWRLMFAGDGMRKVELLDAVTGTTSGELILVDGRTLLTRSLAPTRDGPLEFVDDAMLSQQIATVLLQQAFPGGPARVGATHKISAEDNGEPIIAETAHTSRVFSPPWTVRGSARRVDADSVEFDMTLVARINAAKPQEARLSLSGTWRREASTPKLPDAFSLSGWSVWRIRAGTREAGGISTVGFIATPESRRYQTLGELRAATRPSQ